MKVVINNIKSNGEEVLQLNVLSKIDMRVIRRNICFSGNGIVHQKPLQIHNLLGLLLDILIVDQVPEINHLYMPMKQEFSERVLI